MQKKKRHEIKSAHTLSPEQHSLELLLASIDDHLVTYDREWRYKFVNDAAARVLGKKPDELLGKSIWKLFPEAVGNQYYRELHEALRTQKRIISEHFYPPFNKWFENHIYPFKGGVTVFSTDITARKHAEALLVESEERFRTMADAAPVFVGLTDEKGKVLFVNRTFLEFLGKTAEDVLGDGYGDVFHPEDLPIFTKAYGNSLRTHSAFTLDCRLRRHDGAYRWLYVTSSPRFNANGTFLGFVSSGIDITDIKRLEKQKDEFIGIASHELKTPITTIKAYTQVLSQRFQKKGDHASADLMSKMDAQLNRLTGLINDLLDVTKMESGKLEFQVRSFDLNALIRRTVEEMRLVAREHPIDLRLSEFGSVRGDRERVGQVLTNFLTNAIKYSPPGKKITVTCAKRNGEVVVSVKDSGIGIPVHERERIFDRFYRIAGDNHDTYAGLGLGLYISREIVERHGGKIWVTSKEGRGSTFSCSLPLKTAPRARANK